VRIFTVVDAHRTEGDLGRFVEKATLMEHEFQVAAACLKAMTSHQSLRHWPGPQCLHVEREADGFLIYQQCLEGVRRSGFSGQVPSLTSEAGYRP
jgi:hypothetical protein